MNRIDELFLSKNESVLSVYFTAGYPELNDTALIIGGLEKAGADLIEIGFPFSDPVADGPVIQASSHQALENGMNLDILFTQLSDLKPTSRIPKIMMGYFNTVYQYGMDRFISQCNSSGVDGVIIPDLPPEVYEKEYRTAFGSAGLHFICLTAPQTSPERADYLASVGSGFIYRLSMSATTGTSVREGLSALPSLPRLQRSRERGLPSLIGFGIHDHATFEMACKQANGAIIGTAFIRRLTVGLRNNEATERTESTRQERIDEICENFVRQVRLG